MLVSSLFCNEGSLSFFIEQLGFVSNEKQLMNFFPMMFFRCVVELVLCNECQAMVSNHAFNH